MLYSCWYARDFELLVSVHLQALVKHTCVYKPHADISFCLLSWHVHVTWCMFLINGVPTAAASLQGCVHVTLCAGLREQPILSTWLTAAWEWPVLSTNELYRSMIVMLNNKPNRIDVNDEMPTVWTGFVRCCFMWTNVLHGSIHSNPHYQSS